MKYEKNRMARWDEYAILKTAKEQGKAEGITEGKAEVVKNLIQKMGLTDAQAADIAEVSVNFVKNIREGL